MEKTTNIKVKTYLAQTYLFYLLQKYTGFFYEKKIFKLKHGYPLNINNPKTFSEKIVCNKLFNRNKLLKTTTDKIEVKQYLVKEHGELFNTYLIPTIFAGSNFLKINFELMPKNFIVKGSHLSGHNLIVRDFKNSEENRKLLIDKIRKILLMKIPYFTNEWAYWELKKRVIIEPLLLIDNKVPDDYKFYCFSGNCQYFHRDFDRFNNHKREIYDKYGNEVDAQIKHSGSKMGHGIPNLFKVIEFVEKISRPFKFVRTDIYIMNDKIYFGEFTHYPGSGMVPISPYTFDEHLGNFWSKM